MEKTPGIPGEYKIDAAAALLDIAFQSDDADAGKKRVDAILADANAPTALKDRAGLYQMAIDGAKGDVKATIKKIEDYH